MTATFKWGLISTARINGAILDGMRQSERGEVLAVASRDLAKAQAYARDKNIPRAYGSYAEMLADPDIQVVYNSLPNHLHAEWTIRALEAGKHVLCEKPFALSLAEVDAMFAAARAHGRVLTEAFMYRHHPKVHRFKELVDSQAVGPVRLMRTSFAFWLDRPKDVRWDPALGGGVLWDVGCYCVSLARYLFGAPTAVFGWQRRAPSGVDETFVGTLIHPGEVPVQFDCSFRAPYNSHALVVGEQGRISFNLPFQADAKESKLVVHRKDEPDEVIEISNPARYWLEIEDIHDAILTGSQPAVSAAETRGVVETVLDLYASAAQNDLPK